jgi:hypothetical protein
MLKEQQITSHVFESLLLTAKAQDVFAVLPTGFGESRLIYQVLVSYRRCFLSYIAFVMVR